MCLGVAARLDTLFSLKAFTPDAGKLFKLPELVSESRRKERNVFFEVTSTSTRSLSLLDQPPVEPSWLSRLRRLLSTYSQGRGVTCSSPGQL